MFHKGDLVLKWIGLTGGIATGKSTFSKILRDLGWPVVDADTLARKVVAKGSPGLKSIVAKFGEDVLNTQGELDRKSVGKLIFEDQEKRLLLESILHPLIQVERNKEKRKLEETQVEIAFYDVPLLFEKEMKDEFDATVLVYAKPEKQKERLRLRDNLSDVDIDRRLNSQMPIDKKMKLADYVVFNEGSEFDLKSNALTVVSQLLGK